MNRGGFTLIELLIATSAFGLAVVGAMAAQVVCRDLARQSRDTTIAMAELQAGMEELMLQPPQTLPLPGSTFEAGIPVPAYLGRHLENESIFATYPNWGGGALVPNPLEVVLTITWDDPRGRLRSLQLTSAVLQ